MITTYSYLSIAIPKQDVSSFVCSLFKPDASFSLHFAIATLIAVIAGDFRPKSNFWLVIKTFLRTLTDELNFP